MVLVLNDWFVHIRSGFSTTVRVRMAKIVYPKRPLLQFLHLQVCQQDRGAPFSERRAAAKAPSKAFIGPTGAVWKSNQLPRVLLL